MTAEHQPAPLTREEVVAIVEPFFADVLRMLTELQADMQWLRKHLDGEHGSARGFEPYDPAGGPIR